MKMQEKIYYHWFCFQAKVSNRKKRTLLQLGFKPERIFFMTASETKLYFTNQEQEVFKQSQNLETTKREMEWLNRYHGWTVFWDEESYPGKLKEICDYPLGLYGKGKLPDEERLSIAMVGARDASPYGVQAAEYFARELASAGVQIISGLARGIDGHSHKSALNSGYTLGVLGCGLDIQYPKSNAYLYEQLERYGGIVTEYPLGTMPMPQNFPCRNRIISGLSHGVFVIEARERSGSLITADLALDQGREVFALSGRYYDILSSGCLNLLQKGAKLVYKPENITEEFPNWSSSSINFVSKRKISLAKKEKLVYDCLRLEPKHVDIIVKETNLPVPEVLSILTILEIKQYIIQMDHNYYRMKD
ncbi:MAG: DNA-processing protein DprA [Lachnospiraceae bacterium]|nr:DNA-processing protein DprA [Lachnospiraceae bacterium]